MRRRLIHIQEFGGGFLAVPIRVDIPEPPPVPTAMRMSLEQAPLGACRPCCVRWNCWAAACPGAAEAPAEATALYLTCAKFVTPLGTVPVFPAQSVVPFAGQSTTDRLTFLVTQYTLVTA